MKLKKKELPPHKVIPEDIYSYTRDNYLKAINNVLYVCQFFNNHLLCKQNKSFDLNIK